MKKPRVLTIIGPTASGKTALSIITAEKLSTKTGKDVEIISADSRQIYRHIPITSAQPSKEELAKFKHHFINELELDEEFNAGEFGKKGRELIASVYQAGKIPVIAGGSGLYINSLLYGLFEYDSEGIRYSDPVERNDIRDKLYDRIEKEGIDKLIGELKEVDPETVKNMPHVTTPRVVRALQVYYTTGIPLSVHRAGKVEINFEPVIYGISMNRAELYGRINKRVDSMIENGMIEEISTLKEKEFHYKTHNSLNTVGAKEVFDYLDKQISYDKMKELIKQNSRRYAKRQLTWFRKDVNIKWVEDVSAFDPFVVY
jgi:tRNA dimethylallyltransferase